MDLGIKGLRVMISAGANGIGLEIARAFVREGALVHVCDVAGSLGFGQHFERGPGRHGIGNAFFVYFRDPDGHRVELFNAHYQAIDINHTPLRWDLSNTRRSQLWGLPAPARWFYEASEFAGKPVHEPVQPGVPPSNPSMAQVVPPTSAMSHSSFPFLVASPHA